MSKLTSIVLFVLLVFLPIPIFANSGPVFWQGYPASGMMSIAKNTPIIVEKENLVFDLSESKNTYSIRGKVTASYTMVNPTNERKSVQMAFPFITKLSNYSPNNIRVQADDVVLPYETYVGNVVGKNGSLQYDKKTAGFDFASVVNTIKQDPYIAKNFTESEHGKRYMITVNPTTDKPINFVVNFTFNAQTTKIFTQGFNGYSRNGEDVSLSAWCRAPQTLEIFVLGEDVELITEGFIDGELRERTDLFTYELSAQEIGIKPYLMEFIHNHTSAESKSTIRDNQLYNLYAQALDQAFAKYTSYSSEFDLTAQDDYERILSLVYTVDFPANSKREVTISYQVYGTMDKTQTSKPIYTFDYILNPAKSWNEFKNLHIKVITPPTAPYVISSNIDLEKQKYSGEDNYIYTTFLPDLPEGDFSFTLCSNEKITFLDRVGGILNNRFGYLTPLIVGATAFMAIGLLIWIIVVRKTKKK